MNVVTVFSDPFLYTKDRAQKYQYIKKTTVCHHGVPCARLSDGRDVAKIRSTPDMGKVVLREKIGRRLPSFSPAPAHFFST